MRLVLATRNDHKLRELAELMRPYELDPLPGRTSSCRPRPARPSPTTRSARPAPRRRATGRAAIADDSGIEAAALDGAPGVWSARYAGEDATDEENLAKLLSEVPADGDRRVAYVCALAYVEPGGRGGDRARALRGPAGARAARRAAASATTRPSSPTTIPGDERTMAELTPDEKDAISHRGRAARALAIRLLEAEEARAPAEPVAVAPGRHGRAPPQGSRE